MTITLRGFFFFCWILFLILFGVGLIFSGTYLHSLPYKDDQWVVNGLRVMHVIVSASDLILIVISLFHYFDPYK